MVAWTVFWFVKDDVLDADPSRSRGFEGQCYLPHVVLLRRSARAFLCTWQQQECLLCFTNFTAYYPAPASLRFTTWNSSLGNRRRVRKRNQSWDTHVGSPTLVVSASRAIQLVLPIVFFLAGMDSVSGVFAQRTSWPEWPNRTLRWVSHLVRQS